MTPLKTPAFASRIHPLEKTYCGRKVVLFTWGDVFGLHIREHPQEMTVCNGWLNQTDLQKVNGKDVPTPYWAVMDAMSHLSSKGTFSKRDVIDFAMNTLEKRGYKLRLPPNGVRGGKASDLIRLHKACEVAWFVLKSHTTHPQKKGLGYGYIVEKAGKGKVRMLPRIETAGEENEPLKTVVLHSN